MPDLCVLIGIQCFGDQRMQMRFGLFLKFLMVIFFKEGADLTHPEIRHNGDHVKLGTIQCRQLCRTADYREVVVTIADIDSA